MTVEKVCRVCLSECDELTPLWVKLPGENKTLEETINFVVNINLKLEDGLPDKICKICESILDLADTFKQRCLESESILEKKAQGKQSEESRLIDEKNHQDNIEIKSEDTSCLLTSIPHTSLSDTSRVVTENDENINYVPKHTIKIEFEEDYVDAEMSMSEQEDFVTIKEEKLEPMFKQCLIKEEFSAETETYSNNEETFVCRHCNMTFWTKFSYKVHIHFHHASFIHRTDTPSWVSLPKLDDMQPTTAAVRSPTEDPAAADTSTSTIIKTECHFEIPEKNRSIKQKKDVGNLKLKQEREGKIEVHVIKKESTEDTASMLKLSGTNTDDKITCATETQATCISNTVIGATGDTLTCDICGYNATTEKSLNSHLKAHAAAKQYSCDSCPYLTTHLGNFNEHIRIHTGDMSYSCDVCDKKFRLKNSFVNHVRRHTGEMPFSCNVCERKFNKKSDLFRHATTHTDDKLYSCNVCEKKFSRKSYVVEHMRTHTGEKPYPCNLCEKQFSVKYNLVTHMRVHTGEKPFSCGECEKKFSRKEHLVTHLTTHSGEKPFSCDMCEKTFMRKSDLVVHVKTHTGEKPYSCAVCGNTFRRKSYAVAHLRTHTGEKPYSCDACEKRFSRSSHLSRHVRVCTHRQI